MIDVRTPVLFVTGTDTGVGKTVTTAALAAVLAASGRSVAVYKPVQAGTDDAGEGDIDTIRRLTGVPTVHDGVRLPEPMAPVAAARRAGIALPPTRAHLAAIHRLAERHDHTLVEGAGGALVQLDTDGHTFADLAATAPADLASTLVVCRSSLGTLNHTDLVLEALARRRVAVAGLVLGSWPSTPTDIDIDNRAELTLRGNMIGVLPEASGSLDPSRFLESAATWFQDTVIPGVSRPPRSG